MYWFGWQIVTGECCDDHTCRFKPEGIGIFVQWVSGAQLHLIINTPPEVELSSTLIFHSLNEASTLCAGLLGLQFHNYVLSQIPQSLVIVMQPCVWDRQLLVPQFHLSHWQNWVSMHSEVLILIDHIQWPENGSFVQWIYWAQLYLVINTPLKVRLSSTLIFYTLNKTLSFIGDCYGSRCSNG